MIYSRPSFQEYVTARVITLSFFLFSIISIVLILSISNINEVFIAISLLGVGFALLVFFFNRGALRMERELIKINKYLKQMEKAEHYEYKAEFFTQEFEDINENLLKILKNSKKREEIKQRYNAKLKLKNRQRADMISAISHEFRNPIASIMGYAQTLEEDKNIPQPLQEKFLGKIYNNSLKIEALLSRLILWNKFESKEATLEIHTFDLFELAKEVTLSLKEKYPLRDIILEGTSYIVKADKTLIEVVLKNLVENALKYSELSIKITILNNKISVKDNGIGIEEEDISKITKKFYRSKTKSWDNSMGLGLAIVKNILELHKTQLEVISKKGEGSTFSFFI